MKWVEPSPMLNTFVVIIKHPLEAFKILFKKLMSHGGAIRS